MMKYICSIVVMFALCSGSSCVFADHKKIYATWEGFEADKLASIWLIKQFAAPGAKVVMYPKGTNIPVGIQFDTPDAEITRSFNQSTFESLLKHFDIIDPKLFNIGKLIHDIEINTWKKKLYKRTVQLQIAIVSLIESKKSNKETIMEAEKYFDRLYREIPEVLEIK